MKGDKVIYSIRKGRVVKIEEPLRIDRRNFLITCTYGDWSGFRSLDGGMAQVQELIENTERNPNREYAIVERF